MRSPLLRALILMLTFAVGPLRADASGYRFFVIPVSDLAKVAKDDGEALALDQVTLEHLAIARGSFQGIEAYIDLTSPEGRSELSFRRTGLPGYSQIPDDFSYSIGIGRDGSGWDVLAIQGIATRHGDAFLSKDWMKQKLVVMIFPINYKQ